MGVVIVGITVVLLQFLSPCPTRCPHQQHQGGPGGAQEISCNCPSHCPAACTSSRPGTKVPNNHTTSAAAAVQASAAAPKKAPPGPSTPSPYQAGPAALRGAAAAACEAIGAQCRGNCKTAVGL
jgi:hypothetical protein